MFLRNFDNIALLQLGYGVIYPTTSSGDKCMKNNTARNVKGTNYEDGNIAIKTTGGNASGYLMANTSYQYYNNAPLALNKEDICLGDGNTEVTYDDYKLSGSVVTNKLVKVSSSITYDSENKEYTTTLIATYNNSGTTPITISEWGLYLTNAMDSSGNKPNFSNSSSSIILTYREVLEEPVVIEAGTTATLTFELKVSLFHQA